MFRTFTKECLHNTFRAAKSVTQNAAKSSYARSFFSKISEEDLEYLKGCRKRMRIGAELGVYGSLPVSAFLISDASKCGELKEGIALTTGLVLAYTSLCAFIGGLPLTFAVTMPAASLLVITKAILFPNSKAKEEITSGEDAETQQKNSPAGP